MLTTSRHRLLICANIMPVLAWTVLAKTVLFGTVLFGLSDAIDRFGRTKRSPSPFRGNSQANTKSHSGGLWQLCKRLFGRCGPPAGNWATLAGNAIVAQPQLGTS